MTPHRASARLAAAVLARGLADAVGETELPSRRQRARVQEDAHRWLQEERRELFGFGGCCDALGLDPDAVRARFRDALR